MEVKLIVIGGTHPGQEIPVPGPTFLIGRAPECQLRPRSEVVSRRHCAILLEEGRVAVQDFGSSNGTYVNDEKVEGQRDLKTGDHLKVGPLEFEVQLAVTVGGKKKPKVHSVQEAVARTVQSAADKNLNISGWLADGEDQASDGVADKTTRLAPASPPPAATPAGQPAATAPLDPPEEPKKEKKEKPERLFGSAKGAKKPVTGTSQDAAAEMLKQMLRRNL